jgi:hypothetical protein
MTSTTHQPDVFSVTPLEPARAARSLRATAVRLRPDGRALLVHALVPLALVGAAILLIEGHSLSWLAGMVAGAAATARLTIRRSGTTSALTARSASAAAITAPVPPALAPVHVHDPAAATDQQLASLREAGWQMLRDLDGRFDHYEHVAVGPGGVVLLESHRLARPVPAVLSDADVATERELTLIRRRALAATANLRDELELLDGRASWVQAIVVVWSEFGPGRVADGRCVLVSGPRLVDWLRRRPGQLPPERTQELVEALGGLAATAAA